MSRFLFLMSRHECGSIYKVINAYLVYFPLWQGRVALRNFQSLYIVQNIARIYIVIDESRIDGISYYRIYSDTRIMYEVDINDEQKHMDLGTNHIWRNAYRSEGNCWNTSLCFFVVVCLLYSYNWYGNDMWGIWKYVMREYTYISNPDVKST